jgi:hypothetical protein
MTMRTTRVAAAYGALVVVVQGRPPTATLMRAVARRIRCATATIAAIFLLFGDVGLIAAADGTLAPKVATTSAPSPSFIVRHPVDAEVSEVDRDANVLRLKTEAGRLNLNIPAGRAAQVRRGDYLVVDIVLIHHTDTTRLPRLHDDPPPLLTQRLRGSIAGIQRTLGVVTLATPAGRLTLDLPAPAVAGLRTGNPVLLELAVRRAPDVSALAGSQSSRSKRGIGALLLMLFGRTQ